MAEGSDQKPEINHSEAELWASIDSAYETLVGKSANPFEVLDQVQEIFRKDWMCLENQLIK